MCYRFGIAVWYLSVNYLYGYQFSVNVLCHVFVYSIAVWYLSVNYLYGYQFSVNVLCHVFVVVFCL